MFLVGYCLYTSAWYLLYVFMDGFLKYNENMIIRRYLNLIIRGEILGFIKDRLWRRLLSRIFCLIKNES